MSLSGEILCRNLASEPILLISRIFPTKERRPELWGLSLAWEGQPLRWAGWRSSCASPIGEPVGMGGGALASGLLGSPLPQDDLIRHSLVEIVSIC